MSNQPTLSPLWNGLTGSEREVLRALGEASGGRTIGALSQDLGLAPAAVRSALQVLRRSELTGLGLHRHFITDFGRAQLPATGE